MLALMPASHLQRAQIRALASLAMQVAELTSVREAARRIGEVFVRSSAVNGADKPGRAVLGPLRSSGGRETARMPPPSLQAPL